MIGKIKAIKKPINSPGENTKMSLDASRKKSTNKQVSFSEEISSSQLANIYNTPSHAASYSSKSKIKKAILDAGLSIKDKQLDKWLRGNESYTKHRDTRKTFKRSKVITRGLNYLFDVDLMDMSNVSKENNGITFILVVIDAFSRRLFLEPLPTKSAKDVLKAFMKILARSGKPKNLRSDSGKEFTNMLVQNFFAKNNINHYTVNNEQKASFAERVIRTLKKKIRRFFSHKQTTRYIDFLGDFEKSYNNTYHSTIKMKPINVSVKNEFKLWKRLYLPSLTKAYQKPILKVGDNVRISKLRRTFTRGYSEGWSEEMFYIKKILKTRPVRFKLVDWLGEDLTGSFYREELQKVTKPASNIFHVEKILRKRTRRGKREYLIKWKGWPTKFNSWVDASEVKDL